MIVLALTMRAAITAARPTEPAPKTAMLDPARTASEFITVPAPVCKPQPNGASNCKRQRLGHFHQIAHRRQSVGGKGGLAKEVAAHAAAQRVGPVQTGEAKVRFPEPLAARRVTVPARPTVPAGLVGEHHVVAGLDSLHRLADSFHHTGAFVAQHDGAGTAAFAEINVGMANPAGHQAHQRLVIARTFHFQALDLQWTARRPQHGGSDGNDDLVWLFRVFAPIHLIYD